MKTVLNIFLKTIAVIAVFFALSFVVFWWIGAIDITHYKGDREFISILPEVKAKISRAIMRYEDANDSAPNSLKDLYPDYIEELPRFIDPRILNENYRGKYERYLRYTRFPDGDGEIRLLWYGKDNHKNIEKNRSLILFICNEFGKCSGVIGIDDAPDNLEGFSSIDWSSISEQDYKEIKFDEGDFEFFPIDTLLEVYGEPDGIQNIYKRDWEIAAVLVSDHSFDPVYEEYIYWRSEAYPDWFSFEDNGWGHLYAVRDGTKYGRQEFFLMR